MYCASYIYLLSFKRKTGLAFVPCRPCAVSHQPPWVQCQDGHQASDSCPALFLWTWEQGPGSRDPLGGCMAPQHCFQHLSSGLFVPGFPSNSAKNVFETETDGKKASSFERAKVMFNSRVSQCWLYSLTL